MRAQVLITVLFSFFFAGAALAQSGTPPENTPQAPNDPGGPNSETEAVAEVNELGRQDISSRLQPLGFGLMGDSIDPNTGAIVFSQTDVSLPGNSGLEVAIRRVTAGRQTINRNRRFMGDWNLDIPQISQLVSDVPGFTGWKADRCTGEITPHGFFYSHGFGKFMFYEADQFTDGLKLQVPGQGSKQVLEGDPSEPRWAPHTPPKVTKDHWIITCITDIGTANGGGQGFIATSPNGDIYTFDRLQYFNADPARKGVSFLPRQNAVMLASEVKDKHGNWVKYTYDADARLTKIDSNDGRIITLTYSGSDTVVSSVIANSPVIGNERVWTYDYDYSGSSWQLEKVTQPDGKFWEYELGSLDSKPTFGEGSTCTHPDVTISLKHPYGVKATYTLSETKHGRTNIPYRPLPAYVDPDPDCPVPLVSVMPWFETFSVTKKVLSDSENPSSIPVSQWTYSYQEDDGGYSNQTVVPSYHNKVTKLTDPAGRVTEYHYNRKFGWTYGQLAKTVHRASVNGIVLSQTDNTYVQSEGFGGWEALTSDTENMAHASYLSQAVTTRGSDVFTQEYAYETDPADTDYSYANPIQTTVYSNIPDSTVHRVTDTVYDHKTAAWVLGLPAAITTNGREMATFTYNSLGQKTAQTRYGAPYATFDYYTGGAQKGRLLYAANALGKRTYLYTYKRGLPTRIRYPMNTNVYRGVDDNGWVTSQTDAMGEITDYTRDNMGRVTRIDHPGNLVDTVINYSFGGNTVQTITQGPSKQTITYDKLWRPTLERTQAVGSSWSAYTKTTYNAAGEVTFTSFPSASSNPSAGTDMTYDGLGRLANSTENVAPNAVISHAYYSGNRHRVTDPSGTWTDSYYGGYEGGAQKTPRRIIEYNGGTMRQTRMYRNVHGQMTRLQQLGNYNGESANKSQYFYYNDEQRLCRHLTPESGSTLYNYDANGQLIRYVKGKLTSAGCEVIPGGADVVYLYYDVLGRNWLTNYTDSATPDIYTAYDKNNNVLTRYRGGANWSYTYDELNRITDESLALDGKVFDIAYRYNAHGYLYRKTMPGGAVINITPDGLGRPSTIKYGTSVLASSIDYHASGAVSDMSYGNGHLLTQTLTPRLQPLRLKSVKGSVKAVDYIYTYDNRGLITAINDTSPANDDATYSYDGLRRLTSATGPWSTSGANVTGTFTYDPLGNIKQKTLGSRTVNYTYNSLNRLTEAADSGATGTRALGYDTRGNVTTLGALAFTYDNADQPRLVTGGSYQYDGNLKRVKAVQPASTIYNIYDASGSLVHIDDITKAEKTDYVPGPMGSLARITNGNVTYLHSDHLGTPIVTSDAAGMLGTRERVSPFGITYANPAANDNQAGFTGHIRDATTGLNYMQARYYDPVIGRFLSVDPVGYMSTGSPDYFNRYAYTDNNPINAIDPNGMQSAPYYNPAKTELAKRGEDELVQKITSAEVKVLGTGSAVYLGLYGGAALSSRFLFQGIAGAEIAGGAIAGEFGAAGLGVGGLTTTAVLNNGSEIVAASKNVNQSTTALGRALAKHAKGQRATGTFPELAGSNAEINQQALDIATNILSNPASRSFDEVTGVTTVRNKAGQGVQYAEESKRLIGFLD